MSTGTKLIIGILFLGLIVAGGGIYLTYTEKTQLELSNAQLKSDLDQYREKEKKIVDDNKRIAASLEEAKNTESRLKKQIDDFNTRTVQLSSERDEWKGQIERLRKERDDLMAKLQEKSQAQEGIPPNSDLSQLPQPPSATDQYWAGVVRAKASLELQLNDLKAKLSAGVGELAELKKKNTDMEMEISQLKSDKEDIEQKTKYSEELANRISLDLAKEKSDKRYIAEKIDKLKSENENLRSQIRQLNDTRLSLEKNIIKLKDEKTAMTEKMAETEGSLQGKIEEVLTMKSDIEKKMVAQDPAQSTREVELPPIIVTAKTAQAEGDTAKKPDVKKEEVRKTDTVNSDASKAASAPGFNGHIVSINEENNFVVTDLGEDAGVRVGDNLNVYRGSKYVAALEVIEVRKDICAADIKEKGAKVKVGDLVR